LRFGENFQLLRTTRGLAACEKFELSASRMGFAAVTIIGGTTGGGIEPFEACRLASVAHVGFDCMLCPPWVTDDRLHPQSTQHQRA